MADVKWIKITTDIFDDEKILMIESMPSADSIIVIWFKLLTFAGKQNNDGVFLMSNRIAYTDEMLASIFRRDVNTIRLALNAFQQFGMIEIVDNVITIPNWNKHQTLDSYEKKKERDRLYQAERRAAQRALIGKSSDTSSDSKTTQSSDIAISEEDKEIEKDKDKEELSKDNSKRKPAKHKHGEFQNVLLTDNEFENLANSFGIELRDQAITFLSEYIEEKGYKSKSHNLAIRRWVIDAVKDRQKSNQNQTGYRRKEVVPSWMKEEGKNEMSKHVAAFHSKKNSEEESDFSERAEALRQRLREKYRPTGQCGGSD